MDKVPKLGNLITDDQHRDAVHIAVAPVIAGMELHPGEHIGFVGNAYTVGTNTAHIGIVDPFLSGPVYKGNKFYMFLYPNTITSLRHEWSHPDFEKEDALAEVEPTYLTLKGSPAEEKWVTEYAERIGSNYSELMAGAADYQENGHYLSKGDVFDGEYISEEFWEKFEVITRTTISDRGSFLSCSC
jgi:hypothetical protein